MAAVRRKHGLRSPRRWPFVAAVASAWYQNERVGPPTRAISFGAYLTARWLPAVEVRLDEGTWSMYETNIRAHNAPELGELRLQRLAWR
jgi:hypothetical protein